MLTIMDDDDCSGFKALRGAEIYTYIGNHDILN